MSLFDKLDNYEISRIMMLMKMDDIRNMILAYDRMSNVWTMYIREYIEKYYGWNDWTCLVLISAGELDLLKYAHENGCQYLICKYIRAMRSNRPNKSGLNFNHPFKDLIYELYRTLSEKQKKCMSYLHENPLNGDDTY